MPGTNRTLCDSSRFKRSNGIISAQQHGRTCYSARSISLTIALAIACSTSPQAAQLEPVQLSTVTIHVPRLHQISATRHTGVTTSLAVLDIWLATGTQALQRSDPTTDGTRDVACPVLLTRMGDFPEFADFGGFDFTVVDSIDAYEALRALPQRVKIVQRITVCGTATTAITFNGCSDQPDPPALGTQVLLASTGRITPVTLTHEFGHNQNLSDLGCPTCLPGNSNRIMFFQGVLGRNAVTADECRSFQR